MRFSHARAVISQAGRILLGAIFIYAALAKMKSPQEFADAIAAYQVLPITLINPVALSLPIFELSCGLLVLTGFYPRVGALGMAVMLISFIAAFATARRHGIALDCGCFGTHGVSDDPIRLFSRDFFLLMISGIVYRMSFLREIRAQE